MHWLGLAKLKWYQIFELESSQAFNAKKLAGFAFSRVEPSKIILKTFVNEFSFTVQILE